MPNTPASGSRVVILDFGSQYTQLICRLVRELGVFAEVLPYSVPRERLIANPPDALILSGGPESVTGKASPRLVKKVFDLRVPVLGICYGMQLLSHVHRGRVKKGTSREYGASEIEVVENSGLFDGFSTGDRLRAWMSHGDSVDRLPVGATLTARSQDCPVAGFRLDQFYAIQFHPEVAHTPEGKTLMSNFLFNIAGLAPDWKMESFFEQKSREILAQVGKAHVIGAVSGGVDSTLLAVFLGKILGKRFHPVMVDNGLLRKNETKEVRQFLKGIGVKLKVIDAKALFVKRLSGVTNPERKRKIIGKTFIEVFEKEVKRQKQFKFLAQGTLYPDVIESVSVKGPSHTIKTHHNVGGLPKRMKLDLIEPFRELFKDEVRDLGRKLSVPESILGRHPFPGPGLAVRILGAVQPKRLDLLREVDAIYLEELKRQEVYDDIWQAFAVLLPVQAVGVMGDARTYESVIALRAVTSRDGMTADWYSFDREVLARISNRIINEVPGVNRVTYDVSSKPPATIEWE